MNPLENLNADLNNFEQRVIEASHQNPVLVDFWADWCAPCHALAPQLDKAVAEWEEPLQLVKVQTDEGDDENMKLAGRFQVRGFPTVILFVDGQEIERFSSARTASWIDDWLAQHIPA